MKCITDDLTSIFGNYDTASAENFVVVFETCDRSERTCKTDQEIKDWIQSKYILTLTNEKSFISHEFFESRVASISKLKWFAMNEQTRLDQVRLITRSKLKLNDYQWNIGNMFMDVTDGFEHKVTETRQVPYKNNYWNVITYEMSLQRNEFTRIVYGFLDFLRDLGGLFSALGPFFGSMVAIL